MSKKGLTISEARGIVKGGPCEKNNPPHIVLDGSAFPIEPSALVKAAISGQSVRNPRMSYCCYAHRERERREFVLETEWKIGERSFCVKVIDYVLAYEDSKSCTGFMYWTGFPKDTWSEFKVDAWTTNILETAKCQLQLLAL